MPSPYQFFDILPLPEGGRDSHLRKWDLPGSLKPALHGTIRVWSHMLLPQTFLPASPAVDAESFTPRLTRTSVLSAHVIVKRFGLGSGFTRPLPHTRTRLSFRPLNGAGLPGSMDKWWFTGWLEGVIEKGRRQYFQQLYCSLKTPGSLSTCPCRCLI